MSISTFQRTKPGALGALTAALLTAWLLAQAILRGSDYLLLSLAIVAAAVMLFQTLKDWRVGVLVFLTWMLFEDLVRKNLGNNMAIYFGKDVLVATCLLSFYIARGHIRALPSKQIFFFPLACFFFWALLEVFNPNSPSIWYGVLGLKLYFEYVPLFLLGYALLRNESDLRRFLLFNLTIAVVIAVVGVAQGVTGKALLSPAELAPEIRGLGNLVRYAPITGEAFLRPPSVFVSDGRFGGYLLMMWLLGFGATAYFFLQRLPRRKWLIVVMVVIMAAILLSAVRSALIWVLISLVAFVMVYSRELGRISLRLHRIAIAGAAIAVLGIFALVLLSIVYPEALNSRVAFFQQTLLPSSPTFELVIRVWDYPRAEFMKAFTFPNWALGYGTGTCSAGVQYVTRILGVPRAAIGVENGFGNLILEMGIPGLVLWLVWTCALLAAEWKVVNQLRGTALFPLGFAIFWFSFITLGPGMVGGLAIENFVESAYLFLLSGVLFSLPALTQTGSRTHTNTRPQEKAEVPTLQRRVGKSMPVPS